MRNWGTSLHTTPYGVHNLRIQPEVYKSASSSQDLCGEEHRDKGNNKVKARVLALDSLAKSHNTPSRLLCRKSETQPVTCMCLYVCMCTCRQMQQNFINVSRNTPVHAQAHPTDTHTPPCIYTYAHTQTCTLGRATVHVHHRHRAGRTFKQKEQD